MDAGKIINFMSELQENRIGQIRKEVLTAAIQEFFKINDRHAVIMVINRLVGIGFISGQNKSVGGKTIYTLDHSVIDKYLNDPMFFIK